MPQDSASAHFFARAEARATQGSSPAAAWPRTDAGLLGLAPERQVREAQRVIEAENWVALLGKGCGGGRAARISAVCRTAPSGAAAAQGRTGRCAPSRSDFAVMTGPATERTIGAMGAEKESDATEVVASILQSAINEIGNEAK